MASIDTVGNGETAVPYRSAALSGAVAFVVGYVLTFGLLLVDGAMQSSEASDDSGGSIVEGLQAIGLFFFDTQFVETEFSGGFYGGASISLLEAASTEIPVLLYRLVPVVVIASVAFVYVLAVGLEPVGRDASAKLGATVVVGYLPLAVLGVLLFPIEEGSAEFQPELFPAIVFAGIVYPVACGALGGALAWRYRA